MKKTIRIIVPILLAVAIVVCAGWYLFVYDREFTRDMLLNAARSFDAKGNHSVAAWFYDWAYKQAGDNDTVAVELAEQYVKAGNYTKAETTLTNAISDGGGVELYIALSKVFVQQDKLMDAVKMLNNVKNETVKEQLDMLRPSVPVCSPDPTVSNAFYTQYITVTLSTDKGTLYVSTNGEYPSVQKDKYETGITLKSGENTLQAIAVADNGLVSQSAVFGFTVGGVIEKVNFVDSAMETALREASGIPAGKTVNTDNLWTITEFTIPETALKFDDLRHLVYVEKLTVNKATAGQLSSLSSLSNLKELTVSDMNVTAEELVVIGKLPKLQKLTLNNCGLSTVAGLDASPSLIELILTNNAIRNIEPLSGLKKLQKLNLSHNALNDLTALSAMSTLTDLDVSFNNLDTLSPITSLTGLLTLNAGNNVLTDIKGFQQLTALQELTLSNNKIGDVSALESCSELTKLDISYNAVADITKFSGLNKLTDFNFANNKVTKLPQWSVDCELVNIDGSHNSLSTLEQLKGLRKLNNVIMDYNKSVSSVKALASCPVLIKVSVYGTRVTNVSDLTSQSIVVNYDPTRR